MKGVCEVCKLVDNDLQYKKIKYCKVCDAFICHKCYPDLLKRAKAFVLKKVK